MQQLDDSFNTYITLCLDSLLTFQNRTLTTSDESAFEECSSLISARIAYGATGWGLASFPEGVTKTFFGAGVPDWTVDPSATDVVVPDGVPMIPAFAFYGCSLLTSFVVSDSVTAIGDYAFAECPSLTTASIPAGATLGNDVFDESPTTVTTRGGGGVGASSAAPAPPQAVASSEELEAFWATDMKMMTHIEVPHGATEIPEGALEGCTLVTSIVLPA